MKNLLAVLAMLVCFTFLAACGDQDGGKAEQPAPTPARIAADLDRGPRAAESFTLDPGQAELGESLFEEKICSDCHTLGEADMAPDLLGVLERRTRPWLVKQITDPEWMNEHDPLTKALIEEFDLEMAGPEVSADEAEAILHFLLRESTPAVD